jgi:iron complex transport system substrate-binding protein
MTKPRIVSLCPSNTELVCALGLADCLVGVDTYSDYPPSVVERLPKLGPDLHIDMEKVVDLKPDLTIASLSVPGMERVVEDVRSAGLKHIVLSPHSISDIFEDMRTLASALDGAVPRDVLNTVIGRLQSRVERIREATVKLPPEQRPGLYWEWWPNPIFSPAKENWLTELSELCGAFNVFGHEPTSQVQDDGMRVLQANPDVFLAVWTGVPQQKVPLQKILSRPGWETISAYQKHQLFVLSEGLYCRPSPRLMDGMEQLVALLHPQIAAELSLNPPQHYGPIRLADGSWSGGVTP